MGVVQAEGIRGETGDRQGLLAVNAGRAPRRWEYPMEIGLIRGDAITGVETASGAGAGGVFPFGLRRQAIVLAGLVAQPGDVLLGIVPAHTDHRAVAATPALIAGIVAAAAVGHTGVPLIKRHRRLPHGKGLDVHRALRALIARALRLAEGAALGEASGWDDHHGGTIGTVAEDMQRELIAENIILNPEKGQADGRLIAGTIEVDATTLQVQRQSGGAGG